jgi:pyruvate formate lyase activating enzyme
VSTLNDTNAHPALLGTPEDGKVRCGLCPHACLIADGHAGWCGARGVVDGTLRAFTYGLVSSVANDPIEKKPVFHFCPGTMVLSLGSAGCSMRCGHCQNWQISRPRGDDGTVALEYLAPQDAVAIAQRHESAGMAFTYNEPVIWLEYVLDTAKLAHEAGLYTVMVTNGYVTPEGLDLFAEHIDVWRVDIKAYSAEPFRHLCHVVHPEAVRVAAERARKVHGMHVECVTNVVPTINDSTEELTAIARWIAGSLGRDTPWHITRFMPYLEFADLEPTPLETLLAAREIGRDAGLDFVYLGNVLHPGGEDTICPKCGARAVRREGFSADAAGVRDGACVVCGTALNVVQDRCRGAR